MCGVFEFVFLLFVFVCGFRLVCFGFVFVISSFLWWCFCRVGCDMFWEVVVVFDVSFCVVWLWWWSLWFVLWCVVFHL